MAKHETDGDKSRDPKTVDPSKIVKPKDDGGGKHGDKGSDKGGDK